MKILQVNNLYNNGSTGKITHDIHSELKKHGIESVVCYGRGARSTDEGVYKTCPEWYSKLNNLISRFTGIMYCGCLFSTLLLKHIIRKEKPDVVHLQCINGYFVNIPALVRWLKENRIRTVLTLHAEFMYTGGCGYSLDCDQWKDDKGCGSNGCPRWHHATKSLFFDRTNAMWTRMYQSFEGFNNGLIVVSVSPWLMERAKSSPIMRGKNHRVIYNGLDIDIFKKYDCSRIRKELGIEGKKIIFHATPYLSSDVDHIKGGYYVIELANKLLKEDDVVVVVAGNYTKSISLPDNMIMLGRVEDPESLARYYSMADVTILTSKRETFSMIVAESLCCGTPVVGFKAGAPEQIAISKYSEFVDFGDMDSLYKRVIDYLSKGKIDEISEVAHKEYGQQVMVNNYIKCYRELLECESE